jgi:hypothetical protein
VFEVAFVTYAVTDRETEIWDTFTVEVFSNGANSLSAAVCDFTGVSIKSGTEMSGDRTYQVMADFEVEYDAGDYIEWEDRSISIDIPIEIEGLTTLTPKYCAEEVYMALEMQRPNQKWKEMWNNKHEY